MNYGLWREILKISLGMVIAHKFCGIYVRYSNGQQNSLFRKRVYIAETAWVQSAAKLFEHLRLFVSKNSQQFYEIDICQFIISRLYTVYNKHEMLKIENQTREKHKYYRKCSNNFAADCTSTHRIIIIHYGPDSQIKRNDIQYLY